MKNVNECHRCVRQQEREIFSWYQCPSGQGLNASFLRFEIQVPANARPWEEGVDWCTMEMIFGSSTGNLIIDVSNSNEPAWLY